MANDDLYQDLPETPTQSPPETPSAGSSDLPERLRIHTLARALGTTSRRVLDTLTELDGRTLTPQSTVDRSDAERVRQAIAAASDTDDTVDGQAAESASVPSVSMPLFVAPQPIRVRAERARTDEFDDAEDSDDTSDDADDSDGDTDQSGPPANRRRRRGRRGRGRGRGEQPGGDDEERDEADQRSEDGADDSEDDDGDDEEDNGDSANGEAANRRRRRRRRRKGGSGTDNEAVSADDPPNTVVHERAPRSEKADKDAGAIQGISGSTRLEAKRQRRRDGRDAGRRRPPILTEAEFLARREAVNRVMVVRDKVRSESPHAGSRYTQIAVLEDGIVVEHFVTSAASASLVGNIYLGVVQNVLPSMEAAFVDIGRGRNGVLYAGEVNWEAAGLGGANRKIEQALKPGDYVVVQVSKDPVGHKGARLTTQVSLAGRFLVYVPGAASTGISRKLPDNERQRLKQILRDVVPDDAGVIIRTASEGVKEEEIRADVTRLQERWTAIAQEAEKLKGKASGAAVSLYEEPDVLVKVIRDLFNEDFSGLIVAGDAAWETINEYVNSVAPDLVSKLTKYDPPGTDGPDVFAVHRIDEQLAKAMDRKVWLPSGGTLVIDRTEAMTVIDVNTGKFTGAGGNLEQTVTKNNLEAAEEIVRQLRLRDIGGMIVIDFIDMVLESNRDLVLRRLTEALARDRTRHQVSEVTSLGLVQLTRKRLGTGLVEAFSSTCAQCAGRGIVLHADPVDTSAGGGGGGGRRQEPASRRSKRSRKPRAEEPVATTAPGIAPGHSPAEHPMFKAMAANGKHDDSEESEGLEPDGLEPGGLEPGDVESEEEIADELEREHAAEDVIAEDSEEDLVEDLAEDLAEDAEADLDEDVEEIDLDEDDDEDDDDLEDEDEDEEDDDDEGDEDNDDEDGGHVVPIVTSNPVVGGRRPRRRSAARPAGPPA